MTQAIIHCGMCGHDLDLGFEFEATPETTRQEVTGMIPERLGAQAVECSRCRSTLLVESVTAGVDEHPRYSRARAAEAMKKRGVRWAVGTPNGPRSTIWRAWTNGSDIYIAPRPVAGDMKISLHAGGNWRSAFTQQHMERANPLIPRERDRAVDKWKRPPEFASGWTRGFTIIVPGSEVRESEVVLDEPHKIVWLDPAPPNHATHFDILIAAPGATGSEGRGYATAEGYGYATEIVTVLELASGERMWVVAHTEPMTDEQHAMVNELRQRILETAGDVLRRSANDPEPHDFRAFGSGIQGDGTRFYLDLVVSG